MFLIIDASDDFNVIDVIHVIIAIATITIIIVVAITMACSSLALQSMLSMLLICMIALISLILWMLRAPHCHWWKGRPIAMVPKGIPLAYCKDLVRILHGYYILKILTYCPYIILILPLQCTYDIPRRSL